MARPRTLPDPEPRDCARCGRTFTPRRKAANMGQRYCSGYCQRNAILRTDDSDAQRARAARPRDDLRVERPKGYRKVGARHEHRVVAERMIGRKLLPGEVVHHRDGDRHNNDPSNLVVLKNQGEHMRLHADDLQAGKAAARARRDAE